MSEKLRFHKMTKPIKFRRTKVLLRNIKEMFNPDKIKFSFYSFLLKLKLVEYYEYHDTIFNDNIDLTPILSKYPERTFHRSINTKYLSVLVDLTASNSRNIDTEFFYVMKKGERKKLYVVRDTEFISNIKLTCRTNKKIGVKVDGQDSYYFSSSDYPEIRVLKRESLYYRPFSFEEKPVTQEVKFDTYTFNLDNLVFQVNRIIEYKYLSQLEVDGDEDFILFIYNSMVDQIEYAINKLKLEDLVRR